jgi:hypothetical protein
LRIYKNKWFDKFARKESINDSTLFQVIQNVEKRQSESDLGGGVIKQRIARFNEGKSGGYRSIIFYRKGDKAFFVYGFAKNEKETLEDSEEREFKKLAKIILALSEEDIEKLVQTGAYKEVHHGEDSNV